MSIAAPDADALAAEFLAAREQARLLPLPQGLDLPTAYRVAARIDAARIDAGEQPRGWKIGFTNRSIWPRYGVHQPIWARVWDTTLTLLEGAEADVSLAGLVQPRIEPEIVFGIARTPQAGMDETALLACLAWVAHGVEIVHTHFDGWKFQAAADPVADFGLHGRLLVGPRRPVADWPALGADLAAMTLALKQGGELRDQGQGALVLDGPLSALRHWLAAMAELTPGVQLQPGDVVTTGTLTDAWPVAPGETWSTHPGDVRLPSLCLRFTA
jgi:2-oxo-3-hexenedioate decarboxylase